MNNFFKNIFLSMSLMLGCVSPEMISTSGPLERQVARVASRHDAYVEADGSLGDDERSEALAESAGARAMMGLPEVNGHFLEGMLEPVLDRHDSYVSRDISLDDLERAIYLASSESIRSYLAAVPELAPAQ